MSRFARGSRMRLNEEAERMNQRALDGYEKVLGKEHPSTLTSVGNLASVLQYQGKYEEAERMNRRALDGYEKVLGKEHPDTLTSISNLACLWKGQGRDGDAMSLMEECVHFRQRVLGPPGRLPARQAVAFHIVMGMSEWSCGWTPAVDPAPSSAQ